MKFYKYIPLLILFPLLSSNVIAQTTKLGFLGTASTSEGLSDEEAAAFAFVQEEYDAIYISFNQLSSSDTYTDIVNVIWWHSNTSQSLPALASNSSVIDRIHNFLDDGKGLFLSGFATQWVVQLGVEDSTPQEVVKGSATSGNWGFLPKVEEHPIFNNLPSPFVTLSSGNTTENLISWWNVPATFDGTWLADTEWNSGTLVTAGEYEQRDGSIIVVGAGAYDWHLSAGTNQNQSNLELFTENIIRYLTPEDKLSLGFLISENDTSSLDPEIKSALNWASTSYEVSAISLKNGEDLSLIADQDIIWWHEVKSDTVFEKLNENAISVLTESANSGQGILFSGTANIAVKKIGLEPKSPIEFLEINEPSTPSGFFVKDASSPIFQDLSTVFITLASGLEANQRTYIWADTAFSGNRLADTEFQDGQVSIGEYDDQNRKVIIIGSKAFDWHQNEDNASKAELQELTKATLDYLSIPNLSGVVTTNISFENVVNDEVIDSVESRSFYFFTNFSPQFIEGPVGQALRFDGYTTWLSANLSAQFINPEAFTIELVLALESNSTETTAFTANKSNDAGFTFGMNNIGNPIFSVRANNLWETIEASEKIPKSEWVHLVAVFDGNSGMSVYLNGEQLVERSFNGKTMNPAFETEFEIGRNSEASVIGGIFPTGILNGYIDEVKMSGVALSAEEIHTRFASLDFNKPVTFEIPTGRYDDDIHRPLLHPMPESDWTNETHGLIEFNGKYHVFFQKNPTGPFFRQLHWGHIISDDLLKWEEVDYAFAPETSYDRAGTWSGAVVEENDILYTFYTSVDGAKASISVATSEDGLNFEKHPNNPLIPAAPSGFNDLDFRDPYLWKEGNEWQMIVGTGLNANGFHGGVYHYTSSDLLNWEFQGLIQAGDEINRGRFWEMPVMMKFGDKRVLVVIPIPFNGQPADAIYWVGDWENGTFVADHNEPKKLELINRLLSPSVTETEDDTYLALAIVPDARPSFISYNSGWVHTYSFIREYDLVDGELVQSPYEGLASLRRQHNDLGTITLSPNNTQQLDVTGKMLEIEFDLIVDQGTTAGINVWASESGSQRTGFYFDESQETFFLDMNASSSIAGVETGIFETRRNFESDTNHVRIFLDNSIMEVFINNKFGFAKRIYPDENSDRISLFSNDGTARFENLKVFNLDPNVPISNMLEGDSKLYDFELLPNYPNPFNPSTNITFSLANDSNVTLSIYDILGRKISTLIDNQKLSAGNHQKIWNSANDGASSGIYILKLESETGIQTKKMTLIK